MDSEQIERIKEISKPIVEQEDLYLVDVAEEHSGEPVLWIYVDSEEGDVSVDACTRISRELGFVLDAHENVRSRYRLNVSSPGLSRPLSDIRQYRKNRGRVARIKYRDSDGYHKLEGVLKQVDPDRLEVETESGERHSVTFESIAETKIIPTLSGRK